MAEIKFEGIAKLNKGLKKRMDMSAVKSTVKLNGSEMESRAIDGRWLWSGGAES